MRMWDAWSAGGDHDRPIDFADFEATGGLGAALSNHADEIYDALPDDRHRSACEKIFKTLTEKGDDNRGIRRPTRLAQLQAIAAADRDTVTTVLDAYRGAGVTFLMPGTEVELADRTVLDLSHESLMRGWQRLRMWVEDEAQSARIFRRLLDTARLWSDGKAGLFRDPDLQIALSWREQEAPECRMGRAVRRRFRDGDRLSGNQQRRDGSRTASQGSGPAARAGTGPATGRSPATAAGAAAARGAPAPPDDRRPRRGRGDRGRRLRRRAVRQPAGHHAGGHGPAKRGEGQRTTRSEREQSQQETARPSPSSHRRRQVEGSLSKAEAAERLARTAEEAGRKLLYTTDMRLAPFVWRDDRTTAEQLRVLLAKHIPSERMKDEGGRMKRQTRRPKDLIHPSSFILHPSKSDLRGFEWYYYQHLLERSAAVFSGHGESVVDAAFTTEWPAGDAGSERPVEALGPGFSGTKTKRAAATCPAGPALKSASCRPTAGWRRWPKGTRFASLTPPRAMRSSRSIRPILYVPPSDLLTGRRQAGHRRRQDSVVEHRKRRGDRIFRSEIRSRRKSRLVGGWSHAGRRGPR